MDPITILSIIATIVGIFGIPSIFASYRRFWKYIGYSIYIKIFNSKPMVLDLFFVSKYDEPPLKLLDYMIFNEFKTYFQNAAKFIKQKTRPESLSFLITTKDELFWFPISVFLDEERDLTISDFENEKDNVFSYNITIRLGHSVTLNWRQLRLVDDLTNYFNTLHGILKNNLYEAVNPRVEFYVCNINRNFSLEEVKREYKDLVLADKIISNKKKISITGKNILSLKKIIKKYFMGKFSLNIRG